MVSVKTIFNQSFWQLRMLFSIVKVRSCFVRMYLYVPLIVISIFNRTYHTTYKFSLGAGQNSLEKELRFDKIIN